MFNEQDTARLAGLHKAYTGIPGAGAGWDRVTLVTVPGRSSGWWQRPLWQRICTLMVDGVLCCSVTVLAASLALVQTVGCMDMFSNLCF